MGRAEQMVLPPSGARSGGLHLWYDISTLSNIDRYAIPSRGACSRRISIAIPPIPTIFLLMVSDHPIGRNTYLDQII